MRGVKYIGPLKDYSGYSEAARNYVLSLYRAGVPITTQSHCFDHDPPPVGTAEEREIFSALENKKIDFDIVIVHLTPDLAPAYVSKYPDKYVISYTVWETSRLHPLWIASCNKVREVWVPSEYNAQAFRDSGVSVPIHKIPHGIDPGSFDNIANDFSLPAVEKNTFIFYSIFQWNARKNPVGLLRAYFNAFSRDDDVALVLKTYIGAGIQPQREREIIREQVSRIKQDMGFDANYFPRVILINDKLSTEQMKKLHLRGDAYVSLHHGEGWGLCPFEAGLAGNAVVATGMGGNMEFMDEHNSYPVEFQWNYVREMSTFNRWYLGDQVWGEPSLIDAANKMRYAYLNRDEAKERGRRLKQRISEEFSWESVSKKMVRRLKDLVVENPNIFELTPFEILCAKAPQLKKEAQAGFIPDPNKLPITLLVIAKNEESCIAGCIDSVKDYVSEAVILDTGSTDKTVAVARLLGARVYCTDFSNFGDLANLGIALSSQPYVLILDCDERLLRPELLKSHLERMQNDEYAAVAFPRSRWADWEMAVQNEIDAYPDWQVRFFKNNIDIGFRRANPHVEFHGTAVKHFPIDSVPEVAHFCDLFPERRKVRYKQNKSEAKKGGLKFYLSECCRQEVFGCLEHPFLNNKNCSRCSMYKKMVFIFLEQKEVSWESGRKIALEAGAPSGVFDQWHAEYESL